MPDPPRKPESSRAFETHADDAKPTGFRRYINILAIVVPILIALVLVLIIVHSLNQPANTSSPTASTEPAPAPNPPPPTPTAESTPPTAGPAPKPAVATVPKPAPAATPPPTAPAPPATADPIFDLSAGDAAALRISGDTPQVPAVARLAQAHGMVTLDAIISKTGTVQEVHVVSGPSLLQTAALTAAKTNRYRPYLVNGGPVRVHTQIYVNFEITPPASQK
jgi:periplasmic protein TonB